MSPELDRKAFRDLSDYHENLKGKSSPNAPTYTAEK